MTFSDMTASVVREIPNNEDRIRILDYVEDPSTTLNSDEAYALVQRLNEALRARGEHAVLVLNFEDLVAIGHDFGRLAMASTVNRWVGYEYCPAQHILGLINDAAQELESREVLGEESGTSFADIIRSAMERSSAPMVAVN